MRVGLPGDPSTPGAPPPGDDLEPGRSACRRRGSRPSSTWLPAGGSPRSWSMVTSCSRRPATGHATGARSRWHRTPAGSEMPSSRSVGTSCASPRRCRRTPSTGRSSIVRWQVVDGTTIAIELGPDWPFAGGVVQTLRADRRQPDVLDGAPRRRADARLDRMAPVVHPAHPGSPRRTRARRRARRDVPAVTRPGSRPASWSRPRPDRGTTASPTCAGRPSCAGPGSSS